MSYIYISFYYCAGASSDSEYYNFGLTPSRPECGDVSPEDERATGTFEKYMGLRGGYLEAAREQELDRYPSSFGASQRSKAAH